jgi:hypothetical protein
MLAQCVWSVLDGGGQQPVLLGREHVLELPSPRH